VTASGDDQTVDFSFGRKETGFLISRLQQQSMTSEAQIDTHTLSLHSDQPVLFLRLSQSLKLDAAESAAGAIMRI